MRILCGTDFSEHARQASRVAAALAQRLAEPLLLVHALDFPDYAAKSKAGGVFRMVKASRQKELVQEAGRNLKAGASVKVQLHAGRADEALVELAQAKVLLRWTCATKCAGFPAPSCADSCRVKTFLGVE
jgi:nucleotide-binding universal stress UspA family protein